MDRSSFSRFVIAGITAFFLLAIFAYRQYQLTQRFELSGVVEGFYGTPWSHEARLDMIRFMGEVGMDVYFYAPKDDPYHRQRWRESYSGEELARFQELIRVSENAGVTLYYAISPGLSMKYSSEDDYQSLREKLMTLSVLGIQHFALFLDDVPEYLQHEDDISQYSSLAEAHVELINRLHIDLSEFGLNLVVCPTTYTDAWGSREYIRVLGDGVDRSIPFFWTGTDVAVASITESEASYWGSLINRKPLIWDNFPVNDFEVWRPIIGPITGRDAKLSRVTSGIIANPMDKPYLSMIPLFTVAKFAQNPHNYNPDKVWQDALTHLAGTEGARVLRPLALLFKDYGWTDNVFTPIYTPGKQFELNTVRDALTLFEETMDRLRSDEFLDNEYIQHILPELEPFVTAIRQDYDEITSDPYSRPDAEGFLIYEIEREAYFATISQVQLDGRLNEWGNDEFRTLYSSRESDRDRVSVAFRSDGEHLYAAVRVRTNHITSTNDSTWMGGDQTLIAVRYNYEHHDTWIQPDDLLILVRPPDDSGNLIHNTGSFYLTPFSQRGISDIKMRSISSFFAHFVSDPHSNIVELSNEVEVAGGRTSNGYSLEVRLHTNRRQELGINISVNDIQSINTGYQVTNFMFSRRPYIGNIHVYPEVIIQ